MSITSLFTKNSPTIGVFTFDAVLEDTFEATYDTTTYVIEAGAEVADHRLILPRKYTLTGLMSNNPLQISATDFIGGAISNALPNSGVAALAAGISAGALSGSDETRASAALKEIVKLADKGTPVTVDAGDIVLDNMTIKSVRRTKTPANETGLEVVVDLEELPTLDRITAALAQPNQDQLRDGDPAKSQAAATVDKGQTSPTTPTMANAAKVSEVIS